MEEITNFIDEIISEDLRNKEVDHVHTRFPPEPNGYLHIGSAKAIWINHSMAKKYGGKFNLRLDDTNPAKEDTEYVDAIKADLEWLGTIPDGGIFYGSDYFEKCYEFAVQLIKEGKAYVCDLSADEMREYRGTLTQPGKESPCPLQALCKFRTYRKAIRLREFGSLLRAQIFWQRKFYPCRAVRKIDTHALLCPFLFGLLKF